MSRKRAAIRPATGGARLGCRLVLLVIRGFAGRDRLLDVLQRQRELIRIELLGSAAELHPLKLAQQMQEAVVLDEDCIPLRDRGVPLAQRRSQARFKRLGVGWGLISRQGSRPKENQICSRLWREISPPSTTFRTPPREPACPAHAGATSPVRRRARRVARPTAASRRR